MSVVQLVRTNVSSYHRAKECENRRCFGIGRVELSHFFLQLGPGGRMLATSSGCSCGDTGGGGRFS